MGYIRHEAVLAIVNDYAPEEKAIPSKIAALKADWPKGLADCILGPMKGTNGYTTWVFAPDGSKEGWDTSNQGDEMRARFIDIMCSVRWPCLVHFQLGGDDSITRIIRTTDEEVRIGGRCEFLRKRKYPAGQRRRDKWLVGTGCP